MQGKTITVCFYRPDFSAGEWRYPLAEGDLDARLASLAAELARFAIDLEVQRDDTLALPVKGYGDLLNTVRIRSPRDGIGNLCLGHVLGASPNRDLFEDIRRGVNRVAFAPETVEPEGSHKVVCHNCGCGC